jgi:Domain of unknown function (DUF3303)
MKFMLTFKTTPDRAKRDEAIQRFLKTGGQPPKGAKLLGRWTAADFSHGFDLLESDDVKPLTQFAVEWNDLMEQQITPVVEDRDLAEILTSTVK